MSDIKLLVELDAILEAEEWKLSLQDAGGVVVDPLGVSPDELGQLEVDLAMIRSSDPQRFEWWQERESSWWVAEGELDEIARFRDHWPALQWLPRIALYKQDVSYHFNPTALGEGFRFYVPDTAAINGYLTLDGDRPLEQELRHAVELGFSALWLHGSHAKEMARGLDLELLERAERYFSGELWFSGGVSDEQHLFNLARQGGAAGVIVPQQLTRAYGCDRLQLALESGSDAAVPLTLEPCRARVQTGA